MVQEVHSTVDSIQPKPSSVSWWQWIVMYPSLFLAVVGNVPYLLNAWTAFREGVPVELAQEMKKQAELWHKNLDCIGQSRSVTSSRTDAVAIDVMLCPTGDMLVSIQDANPNDIKTVKRTRQWLELTTPPTSSPSALSSLLMPSAIAATVPDFSRQISQLDANAIAQVTVLCQKLLGDNKILRRLQYPDGRCVDEVVNTLTGAVVSQTASNQCSAGC